MGTLTVNIGFDPARIKDQRLKRLWSQDELAQAASLNVRTVQRVEAGASASLETGRALADALDVSVNRMVLVLVVLAVATPGAIRLLER